MDDAHTKHTGPVEAVVMSAAVVALHDARPAAQAEPLEPTAADLVAGESGEGKDFVHEKQEADGDAAAGAARPTKRKLASDAAQMPQAVRATELAPFAIVQHASVVEPSNRHPNVTTLAVRTA